MKHIQTVSDLSAYAEEQRAKGKTIALVPTAGALHAGHEALVRKAAAQAGTVIVSVFVNPHQYGPHERISDRLQTPAEDLKHCKEWGAHAVFTPSAGEIYPRNFSTFVSEEVLSKPLCGISRPNHFRGVTTLMAKLFNIVRPDLVFFGQKTAQRAAIVRKMAHDLGFKVQVAVVPTVREADGLALGVSNHTLTPNQRRDALALVQALRQAKQMADAGVRSPDRLVAEATHILGQHRRIRVIYVSVVDSDTLEPVRDVKPGHCMAAIAAWVDEVRLIDNIPL
jgi:pantoate--beta-alanine ligase